MQKHENIRFIHNLALLMLFFIISHNSYAQPSISNADETSFALLVDISDYKDPKINALKSEGRGIYEIRDSLHSAGGYPDNQIFLVTDEKATREGIIEALTRVIGRIKTQDNTRFLFYLKARYIKVGNDSYLLPYDARVGAVSTYIRLSEFRNILDKISFDRGSMKAYILATWDLDYKGDENFTSGLADIILNERTDANGDRNITFHEINNRYEQIISGVPELRVITDSSADKSTPLIRLPSTLVVDSEPTGANVFIDDVNKGVTPLKMIDLTQGEHRLYIKKELYHQSEERIFSLNSTRGQKVEIAKYQLMPISIIGSVLDADQNPIANTEIWIDGTDYHQKVSSDGKFRFEGEKSISFLESGKTYNVLFRSLDGMYSGKTSFVFKGTEDINLSIPVIQSDWLILAQQRFIQGDQEGALKFLDRMLNMQGTITADRFKGIQQPLALLFIDNLDRRLQSEAENLRYYIASAILSDIVGNDRSAKYHWSAIKRIAPKESDEYKQAVARLKQLSLMRQSWFVAIILVGILLFLGGFGISLRYLAIWMRFRKFKEIPNPYIAGKPISEPSMFFGREDIFSFIKDKFSRDAKDITIVLYGGRRTGKTSIMYQIANGRLGQDFVPVFIDMQEMAGADAHYFFWSIAQKVNHTLSVNAPESNMENLNGLLNDLDDKGKSAYQSFNKYITAVASILKDKYLLFLIDEYEILDRKVNNGDLSDEIFTYLRHLQNLNNLAFIFSGSGDFAHRERREWSLMFNMAQPKEVSFLSHENAIALITKPVEDYVRYDKKSIERILRLTAAHPFFTQAICLQIIEELNEKKQNKVNIEQVQYACKDIVENAPFHLPFVWSELDNDEKILIALLADAIQDGTSYISPNEIISNMPDYELEYNVASVNKVLSQLIEEHLVERKPESESYRFQMDLVREWVRVEHPVWGVLREVKKNE